MKLNWFEYLTLLLFSGVTAGLAQRADEGHLLKILGDFPAAPPLQIETLESIKLTSGMRYKIRYVVELADARFERPIDRVSAYLFVPNHKPGQTLPAVVAIHQDGPYTHLGKLEPAGLAGDADQHYGLDLFERGYVVICPDRYGHAERRRIPNPDKEGSNNMRDLRLWLRWAGQLILAGRTDMGKEVYDLMRAVDVLYQYDAVDRERVGAIGHSAGGDVVIYFMFVDKRIKAGISSCGFFELLDFFNDQNSSFANSVFALPGLANAGSSADYLAGLAPRPLLMTRGTAEFEDPTASERQVEQTKKFEAYAKAAYSRLHASERLKTIYFEGGHKFPDAVKREAYKWFDDNLKKSP